MGMGNKNKNRNRYIDGDPRPRTSDGLFGYMLFKKKKMNAKKGDACLHICTNNKVKIIKKIFSHIYKQLNTHHTSLFFFFAKSHFGRGWINLFVITTLGAHIWHIASNQYGNHAQNSESDGSNDKLHLQVLPPHLVLEWLCLLLENTSTCLKISCSICVCVCLEGKKRRRSKYRKRGS
jgi:hypothetical protein